MKKKQLTLCVVYEHPRILLGMKKRGFGTGRWNGFGGKLKEGETVEEAAKRELTEEAFISAEELEKRGLVEFEFVGNPEILQVHIFNVKKFSGLPKESEEMRPQWFDINEIPYDSMWPDDKHWLPLFLHNKKFKGKVLFDKNDSIISHEFLEIETFDEK